MPEKYATTTPVVDNRIHKGEVRAINNDAEGYTVYEATVHYPDAGTEYLGRFTTIREAKEEVRRGYDRPPLD